MYQKVFQILITYLEAISRALKGSLKMWTSLFRLLMVEGWAVLNNCIYVIPKYVVFNMTKVDFRLRQYICHLSNSPTDIRAFHFYYIKSCLNQKLSI